MDFNELQEMMEKAARHSIAIGETPEEIEARADEQDRTGFTVSAPFTRLLASTVRAMLKEEYRDSV